jgi:hypothetical protein
MGRRAMSDRKAYSDPVSVSDSVLFLRKTTSASLEYHPLHYLKDKGAPIEGYTNPRWKEGVEVEMWHDDDLKVTWFKWSL